MFIRSYPLKLAILKLFRKSYTLKLGHFGHLLDVAKP